MTAQNGKARQKDDLHPLDLASSALWLFIVLALAFPWVTNASPPGVAYTMVGGEFYQLERSTGELTTLGELGITGIEAMALDPSGTLFAANRESLFRIDPATPVATLVGPLGLATVFKPTSMTFDATGRLWMAAFLFSAGAVCPYSARC